MAENVQLKMEVDGARQAAAEVDSVTRATKGLSRETRGSTKTFAASERASGRARRGLFGLRSEATMTGRGMRVMGRGVAYGGAALAAVAGIMTGKVISAASDMDETLSKSDTTFGRHAAGMRLWARDASSSLGISRKEALDAAAGFAGFGKAAGVEGGKLTTFSKSLVQSATDLASFHNTSGEEALQAIRSGLAGETEPLRRFNIQLNDAAMRSEAMRMGLIKTTKEALTPQQKTLVTQRLILRSLGDAQGDFARTQDSASNRTKIMQAKSKDLQATIGRGLLPTYVRVLSVVNRMIPSIEKFVVGMQSGTGAGGRFADRMKRVGAVISGVTGFVVKHRGEILALVGGVLAGVAAYKAILIVTAVGKGIMFASRAVMLYTAAAKAGTLGTLLFNGALLANPIGLVVAGIVGLGVAVVVAYKKVDWFRSAVNVVWDRLGGGIAKIRGNWRRLLAAFGGPVGSAVGVAIKHFDKLKSAFSAVIDFLKGAWDTFANGLNGGLDAANKVPGVDIPRVPTFAPARQARASNLNGTFLDLSDEASTITGRPKGAKPKTKGIMERSSKSTANHLSKLSLVVEMNRREVGTGVIAEGRSRGARR